MFRVNRRVPVLGSPRHREIADQYPELGMRFTRFINNMRSQIGNAPKIMAYHIPTPN